MSGEDYEVRFLNADGSLSLLLVTNCASDEEACEAAMKRFAEELKPFEIWSGHRLVGKGPQASPAH